MDKPHYPTLRVLLLEDEPTDAELAEMALREAGLSFISKRVETKEAFVLALEEFKPDIVLADYKLPSFDGGQAVKLVRRQHPEIPVVVVTGAVGEETAVELLKWGARDYILKDRLARLGVAVQRVLAEEQDIRARKQMEETLRDSEKRYRTLFELAADPIWIVDADNGTFVDFNTAAHQSMGYTREEFSRLAVCDLEAIETAEDIKRHTRKVIEKGSDTFETVHRTKQGELRNILVSAVFLTIDEKKYTQCILHDITERKKSEEIIWKQANFDPLTGLPNRRMFHSRLDQEIKKSSRTGLPLALMLIDLDRFKEINDTLGHDIGDLLLLETASRINGCVHTTDTVACFGGDEFIVILTWLDDVKNIERLAGAILKKLAEPFQLGDEMIYVTASIGITLYPEDATEVESLLKNADQAMFAAKGKGRDSFSYFTKAMQQTAKERLKLANDLRGAVADRQLRVYFQPIIDLKTGAIHKAEALVRWQHPEHGMTGPAEFIPLAEETGLIIDIGNWVFHESMRWAKRWRTLYNPMLQVSVNKSPVQFYRNGKEILAWLAYLKELDLPGQCLAIEITESLLMELSASIAGELHMLRDAGIQVSLDDFGTGYSSLSYLKKFDIDYLKIDQSFVRDLATDPNDLALSEAIIVMAHRLGIKVIAEGVETKEQQELLTAAGCDYAQGYLYSRPVPPEAFEELLKQQSATGTH